MADNHIEVNEALKHARGLMDSVRTMQTAVDEFKRQKGVMAKMLGGDGSVKEHFTKHVTLYGVNGVDTDEKLTKAKTLFDELNSTVGNMHASLIQFLEIMG